MQSSPETAPVAAIILAAGNSSRLGTPKQLVEIHGKSLLARTIDAFEASPSISRIVVVLGANEALIRNQLPESKPGKRIDCVVNTGWQEGMGSSIACGFRFLGEQHPAIHSGILSVCDQPFLTLSVVQKIIEMAEASPGDIIASSYSGTLGPPVLFPGSVFDELSSLSGAEGARRLLAKFTDRVTAVDFQEGDIDIDTPADLARFRS